MNIKYLFSYFILLIIIFSYSCEEKSPTQDTEPWDFINIWGNWLTYIDNDGDGFFSEQKFYLKIYAASGSNTGYLKVKYRLSSEPNEYWQTYHVSAILNASENSPPYYVYVNRAPNLILNHNEYDLLIESYKANSDKVDDTKTFKGRKFETAAEDTIP